MKPKSLVLAVFALSATTMLACAGPEKPKIVNDFAIDLGAGGPEGIAFDARLGHFYFVVESSIYRSDRKGGNIKRIGGKDGVRYRGITRNAKGHFLALASSSSEVHTFDANGRFLSTLELPVSPDYRAISCSKNGKTIYISDRSKIITFKANGMKIREFEIPGGDIQGIAAGPRGHLWVVDDETLEIKLLNQKGREQRTIALQGATRYSDPEGLWFDEEGKALCVVFDRSSAVIVIDTLAGHRDGALNAAREEKRSPGAPRGNS